MDQIKKNKAQLKRKASGKITPRAPRPSIIMDPVHPSDFLSLNICFACEQCSHYSAESNTCTLGFDHRNHTREIQLSNYNVTGRMPICRFMEID